MGKSIVRSNMDIENYILTKKKSKLFSQNAVFGTSTVFHSTHKKIMFKSSEGVFHKPRGQLRGRRVSQMTIS